MLYYKICSLDIETKDGLKGKIFRLGGFCFKDRNKYSLIVETNYFKFFDNVLTTCESFNAKTVLVFIHNLDFDVRFIMNYCKKRKIYYEIMEDNRMFQIRIGNIIFRDSFQFLLCSQEKGENEYLGRSTKYKIENWDNVPIKELINRVTNDVKGLINLMLQYNEEYKQHFKTSIWSSPTISILAFSIFKKKFKELNKIKLEEINPYVVRLNYFDETTNKDKWKYDFTDKKTRKIYFWTRRAYYGGRVECFNLNRILSNEKDKIYYYDYNSLYPYICATKKFPTFHRYTMFRDVSISNFFELTKNRMYIVEATIIQNNEYPILPIRYDNKLLFLNGQLTGVWCSPEFEYFLKMGGVIVSINVLRVYHSKRKYLKFFSDWYNDRLEAKNNKHTGKAYSLKIVMNSCTGKPAQNPRRNNWVEKDYDDIIEEQIKQPNLIYKQLGEFFFIKEKQEKIKPFMIVDISCFITSYARTMLIKLIHKITNDGFKVYYCDTDSIITNCFIEQHYSKLCCETTLGKLKQEILHIEEFQAKTCKTYYVRTKTKTILKAKGISRRMLGNIVNQEPNNEEKYQIAIHNYFTNSSVFFNTLTKGVFEERYLKYRTSLVRHKEVLSYSEIIKRHHKEFDKRVVYKNKLTYPYTLEEYNNYLTETKLNKKRIKKYVKN